MKPFAVSKHLNSLNTAAWTVRCNPNFILYTKFHFQTLIWAITNNFYLILKKSIDGPLRKLSLSAKSLLKVSPVSNLSNPCTQRCETYIRLGLFWSKFSGPKSSETTFTFLNGDYKNAFSFFLLLQRARSQRFEVIAVTLLNRKPRKMKISYNLVKNGSINKFSKLSDPLRPNGSLNNKKSTQWLILPEMTYPIFAHFGYF